MSSPRLALDLSGGMLRVLEGMPGGPMRCGEGVAPPGALEGGRVLDLDSLSQAVRLLIARTDISATRALVGGSDAIASFRLLTFPKAPSDSGIDASVKGRVNLGSDRMAMRHIEVQAAPDERTMFATVWDRNQVNAIAAAARQAGLEPVAVDLKSLCVARAIPVSSCILLDMSTDPCEAILIEDRIPRAVHSFRVESGGDLGLGLSNGLKPVLAFQRRSGTDGFRPNSPIPVPAEQDPPAPPPRPPPHPPRSPVGPPPPPPPNDG